jgi:DNA-binding MarR family transcriptional regulator
VGLERQKGSATSAAELIASARAIAFASRRLERALGDMTLPQFRVLALVASSTERASRIAERASVSRPSLTGLLDGLETRGWVRRIDVSGDRRGILLEVTPAGTSALAEAELAMAGALSDLLGETTSGERSRTITGLMALSTALRSQQAPR